ncbi:MAG: hypothetical protein ACXVJD_08580 [Mucilaginibacter sp.]
MNPKYLMLYIVAGSLAMALAAYKLFTTDNYGRIALNVVISLFFFYLAYKTYHEKKDKELM